MQQWTYRLGLVEVPVSGLLVVPVLLPVLPVPDVPADELLPVVLVELLPDEPMPDELLPEAPMPELPALVQVLDTFFTRVTLIV